jgi:hypothetical protein
LGNKNTAISLVKFSWALSSLVPFLLARSFLLPHFFVVCGFFGILIVSSVSKGVVVTTEGVKALKDHFGKFSKILDLIAAIVLGPFDTVDIITSKSKTFWVSLQHRQLGFCP